MNPDPWPKPRAPSWPTLSSRYTGNPYDQSQKPHDPARVRQTYRALHHLKPTRREQINDYMGSALADGDLRESAAYDEARMQHPRTSRGSSSSMTS